jgi:hypothetical protein
MGITVSRDALLKRVNREYKNSLNGMRGVEVTIDDDATDDVSGLTPDSGTSCGSESKNQDGRPKGSADDKKRDNKNKRVECINAICETYSIETTNMSMVKSRVPPGFLAGLIQLKKEEYGVSESISEDTIWSCHKQRSLCAHYHGTSSPVASAKVALFEICIQMGRTRQPPTGLQAVKVMNDLMNRTPLKESLSDFQRIRCPNSLAVGSCGISWWQGLKKDTLVRLLQKRARGLRPVEHTEPKNQT